MKEQVLKLQIKEFNFKHVDVRWVFATQAEMSIGRQIHKSGAPRRGLR